jgi:hypothetical protein
MFILRTFLGRAALPVSQREGLRMGVMYSLTCALGVSGVIQLLAASGYFAQHTFIVFYAGQMLFLVTGTILFGVAIFSSRRADVGAS